MTLYLAIIERRCCWTNCGPSNSVKIYEGMETYFCTGDACNGYGVEFALSPPGMVKSNHGNQIMYFPTLVTTALPSVVTTPATMTTTQMTTATSSSTITMPTTTRQTSFQCYQCSGPDCGKDRSTISGSCPSCMAYRNANDQSKIPV